MSYNKIMDIPYYFFGILYLLVLGFYLFILFFNLYHLFKFGFFDFTGKVNAFVFCGAWAIIIFFTWFFLKDVPWFDSFNLWDETFGQISFFSSL